MPFVNYVKENIAFIEYAADNSLRPNEILVWQALFHIMNQRANGNYWPDGFIRVKNDRLLTYAPIGFDSLARARNSLAQRGLISYKPGKKNAEVPMYELHYLTAAVNPQMHDSPVDNAADSGFYPVCYPQFADNMGGNMRDNMGGNMRDNTGGKLSHQNINVTYTGTKPNGYSDDEEDDEDEQPRGRARMGDDWTDEDEESFKRLAALTEEATRAIRQNFGRDATPAEAQEIARYANMNGFGPEMLLKAVRKSALMGARTPLTYVLKILHDWKLEEVTTPDEADEYQFMADAQAGRNNYGSHDVFEDQRRMNEAREARRSKHEAEKENGGNGSYTASGL